MPDSQMRMSSQASKSYLLIAAAILLLAFGLRVWNLGDASLWADEATTAWWANTSFKNFLENRVLPRGGNQLPLHIASLHFFPANNEFMLRFPSIAVSVVATAAVIGLVQRSYTDRSMALVAGLLIATNPLNVWLSRAARPYAYFFAGVVFVSLFFLLLVQGKRSRAIWLGFVVSSALVYLTHYFALFLPAVQYLLIGVYFKRLRALLRPWLLAQIAAGIGLICLWLAQIMYGKPGAIGIGWIPDPRLLDIPLSIANLLVGYIGGTSWYLLIGLFSAGLGFAFGVWRALQRRRMIEVFWLLLSITPLISIFIASKVLHPLYVDRYFSEAQIGAIALMLVGWWQLARRRWRYFLVALVVMSSLLTIRQTIMSGENEREDWRGATEYIAAYFQTGDGFVLDYPYYLIALSHYLPVDDIAFYILTEFENTHTLSDFSRIWVIYRNPNEDIHRQGLMPDFDPYAPALNPTGEWLAERRGQILQHADFNGLSIFLLQANEIS